MKPELEYIKEFPYPYFQYGSEDSTDIDVIICIPLDVMPETQEERKQLVKHLTSEYNVTWNTTLAVIENGVMIDTIYTKAWIDSLNNALYITFENHKQFWENPILKLLKRNKTLAIYKAIRTVLTMLTRTHLRTEIKPVLKGIHPFEYKLEVLSRVNFSEFSEFNQPNGSDVDIWKIIAFYIGQNMTLIESNIEIYTKQDLVKYFPELKPFVLRESIGIDQKMGLTNLKNAWLNKVNEFGSFKSNGYYLECNEEKIDMKNEKY